MMKRFSAMKSSAWSPTISLSPRSSLVPLDPIIPNSNNSSHFQPSTIQTQFNHPFASVPGTTQLLHVQSRSSSTPRSRDPNSTSSSASSTHPDLDLFSIETRQSAHSHPSSIADIASSPRPTNLPQSRSHSGSQEQPLQPNLNLNLDQFTSPTSTSPPPPQPATVSANNLVNRKNNIPIPFESTHASLPRSTTTLWMGDLESWMDEEYIRKCVVGMGWHLPHHPHSTPATNVKIKMVSGASPSSAYCFLTYPTAELAQEAWKMISNMPPTLMPGCTRTFKLNWATGLPGVQPTWDREFSVFIRDLDREVSEGELVSLFTRFFPSTKSAKIMGDLSTGLSRGYAFIRFGEESDLHKAIALGRSKSGTGMYLRGRSIKISEASGSSGTAGDHHHHQQQQQQPLNYHRVSLPVQSSPLVGTTNKAGGAAERPRHASLNVAHESHGATGASSALDPRLQPQLPTHRASLPTAIADLPASREPHQSNGITNHQSQNSSIHALARSSLGSSLPTSTSASTLSSTTGVFRQPGTATGPGLVQTMPNFRPAPASFQILPYQRPSSVCIPPSTSNGLVYATATGTSRPNPLAPSVNPPSLTPLAHHPQTVYPAAAMKHMRNSIPHTASYLPETYHPAGPTPFQIHPGLVSMGNFYSTTATPAAVPSTCTATGYFAPSGPPPSTVVNGNAAHFAALAQIAVAANHANNDPSNTTVFVGGLPACISEDTLKTFFQNFGEITYVKIPPNKGCGFVQYVRRSDAEAAMLKMHDFPIHGKSRIRLSWGRSLGDKQVEYVRKLSAALGIPFDAVWKIVEGQDHSTIKQIASAVGGVQQSSHQQTIPSATVSPAGFHATNPGTIAVTPGGGLLHQSYGSFSDPLLDPFGFTLQQQQQQQARFVAGGASEPVRFQAESQPPPFTTSFDSHRFSLEGNPQAALDHQIGRLTTSSDQQVFQQQQQEAMRYSSSTVAGELGGLRSDSHQQRAVGDPFAFSEVGQDSSRRLRAASEQLIAAPDDRHQLKNKNDGAGICRSSNDNNDLPRLSFSSNDFFSRPSIATTSFALHQQQQRVYSSSPNHQQTPVEENLKTHVTEKRPSPSRSFSGVLGGERHRSFVGFSSDDLLGSRYPSPAATPGAASLREREQLQLNGDSGFAGLRSDFLGAVPTNLDGIISSGSSSLVNPKIQNGGDSRMISGSPRVDISNSYPSQAHHQFQQQAQQRKSTTLSSSASSWSNSNNSTTTGSSTTLLHSIQEGDFFNPKRTILCSSPPYTAYSMDYQDQQQRMFFHEEIGNKKKREEQAAAEMLRRRRREEDDEQEEEWNQLEAEFKMRMKVEEQDSQLSQNQSRHQSSVGLVGLGDTVGGGGLGGDHNGWPDLFGGSRRVEHQLQAQKQERLVDGVGGNVNGASGTASARRSLSSALSSSGLGK